jgi:hypothetical protein
MIWSSISVYILFIVNFQKYIFLVGKHTYSTVFVNKQLNNVLYCNCPVIREEQCEFFLILCTIVEVGPLLQ